MSQSSSAPPVEQQRLREAFMNGDVRCVSPSRPRPSPPTCTGLDSMAFRLLKPQDSCFSSPLGRIVSSILHCVRHMDAPRNPYEQIGVTLEGAFSRLRVQG